MCISGITRARLAVLCICLAAPTYRPLAAQDPAERAVRAAVDSFFADVAAERWDAAAARLDLPRFEPFFKQTLRNARSAIRMPDPTPEQFMAQDSTMPRAVAEWEAARMKSTRTEMSFGDYSYEFAGVTTQHQLLTLTLPDAAARWLAARDRRTQMRESLRRQGCPLATMMSPVATPRYTILGIAMPDDSTAYVIVSDDQYPDRLENLMPGERVLSIHRAGAAWRIEPRRDLLSPTNVTAAIYCERSKH